MVSYFQSQLGNMSAPDWAIIIPIIFFLGALYFMWKKK